MGVWLTAGTPRSLHMQPISPRKASITAVTARSETVTKTHKTDEYLQLSVTLCAHMHTGQENSTGYTNIQSC